MECGRAVPVKIDLGPLEDLFASLPDPFRGKLMRCLWARKQACKSLRTPKYSGQCPQCLAPAVTRHDARASRRFLATPHRDPSVCPRSESRSAHAAGEAGSLEIPIGPFHWPDSPVLSDHPLAGQTPFCAENLEPASLEPAAPGGWLNFWRTNIFRRRGLAAAASSSDVIQDARPRQRSQMKGIRSGPALIARPQWRR